MSPRNIALHRGRTLRKLSEHDLAEILARAGAGECRSALAREFEVAHQTINYHIRQSKAPRCPYATALVAASEARRKGKLIEAAEQLRNAAKALEGIAA